SGGRREQALVETVDDAGSESRATNESTVGWRSEYHRSHVGLPGFSLRIGGIGLKSPTVDRWAEGVGNADVCGEHFAELVGGQQSGVSRRLQRIAVRTGEVWIESRFKHFVADDRVPDPEFEVQPVAQRR